jgi:hypothetical protein
MRRALRVCVCVQCWRSMEYETRTRTAANKTHLRIVLSAPFSVGNLTSSWARAITKIPTVITFSSCYTARHGRPGRSSLFRSARSFLVRRACSFERRDGVLRSCHLAIAVGRFQANACWQLCWHADAGSAAAVCLYRRADGPAPRTGPRSYVLDATWPRWEEGC